MRGAGDKSSKQCGRSRAKQEICNWIYVTKIFKYSNCWQYVQMGLHCEKRKYSSAHSVKKCEPLLTPQWQTVCVISRSALLDFIGLAAWLINFRCCSFNF